MPRFTQRPFVSTAGPVVPGTAAAVGQAVSIGAQAVGNVQQLKAQEEIATLQHEDRVQKLQTQQSEKMDRSRALRDVTQKHIARTEAFSGIMEGARKEGNYDSVVEDYVTWSNGYDVEALEGMSPHYQDTYASMDNGQHKSAVTRMFNFKQAGNLAVQMEDTRDSYANIGMGYMGDPLAGAAAAKATTILKKSEGMKGDFLDPLEFEARKGMVETHLWDTLNGKPLEQEQFLEDIEKDPNTKDLYNDPQIASFKKSVRAMVELEKENANNHKVYKTTASSTSINATIAANDRGDIDFNAAMKQIQNSEATDIEKLNGQERLRKRNVAGAKVHDIEQAALAKAEKEFAEAQDAAEKEAKRLEVARLKDAGDVAKSVAGRMISRYQTLINDVEDGDIEGYTAIQKRWNETLAFLLENRKVLPNDVYAGFMMDALYGIKDTNGGVISAEPFDHFFSFGERKRSPLVKLVDTLKSQPDRPINALKLSLMVDVIRRAPDGFSALAETEEDAQRAADDIISKTDALFATQELGLSQAQAQERQEINSKAQSPTPRPVDQEARARVVGEMAKVMPLEEALEVNAESSSPIPVDEFTAAFTDAKDNLEPPGPRETPDAALVPEAEPEQIVTPEAENLMAGLSLEERGVVNQAIRDARQALSDFRTERFEKAAGESHFEWKGRMERDVSFAIAEELIKAIPEEAIGLGQKAEDLSAKLGAFVRDVAVGIGGKVAEIFEPVEKPKTMEEMGIEIFVNDQGKIELRKKKQENPVIDAVPPPEISLQVEDRRKPDAALTPESEGRLVTFIKGEEGERRDPATGQHVAYFDTAVSKENPEGIPTVGYGHRILPEDNLKVGDTITEEQAEEFLRKDKEKAVASAEKGVPNWDKHPEEVQHVLISMIFQMGEVGVLGGVVKGKKKDGFKLMKAALAKNPPDYNEAADEMLDSDWAKKQTPERAKRAAEIVRSFAE